MFSILPTIFRGHTRLATTAAALIGTAVTLAAVGAPSTAAVPYKPDQIAKVDLSFDNPELVFIDATHWTVPIRSARGSKPGACSGEYNIPEIAAGPAAGTTSVRYGVKYFCTEPVSYSIIMGIFELDSRDAKTANRTRVHQHTGSGLSQNPYLAANTPPCKSNKNSGWLPWDTTSLKGQTKSAEAKTVTTVGCTMK